MQEYEMMQIQGAALWDITSSIARFVDWLQQNKRLGTLTRNEVEFLNEIQIARQKFLDTEDQIRHQQSKQES